MGKLILVVRLAARDLRYRPAEAVLLLLAITAAATTLTLGLVLHGVTSGPYERTRAATVGPDVVARVGGQNPDRAALIPLEKAPGVTAYGGPYPVLVMAAHANGYMVPAEVEGRDQAPSPVDRPSLTAGSWIHPGSVVLERSFASALGLGVGDKVILNGRSFLVSGIAVSAAVPAYPSVCALGCDFPNDFPVGLDNQQPGVIWMTETDLAAEISPSAPTVWIMDLRLANPGSANAYANAYDNAHPASSAPYLTSWQYIASASGRVVSTEQQVLLVGSWLLGLVAVVLLTSPGVGLLGTGASPGLTVQAVAVTAAVAVLVALIGTFIPAVRAARTSTIRALAAPVRPPRRRARLVALSARMPVPLLLGMRIAGRRPRRTALSMASVAVMVSGIIPILASRARLGSPEFSGAGLDNPITDRVDQILLVVTVMLAVLAAINAIFVTWACVHDLRYSSALTRALGATRRQVTAGLVAAQALPAFAGAVLGIPLGIGLSVAAQHGGPITYPPVAGTIVVVAGSVVGIIALTTPAASADTRSSITQTLREA